MPKRVPVEILPKTVQNNLRIEEKNVEGDNDLRKRKHGEINLEVNGNDILLVT